MATTVSPLTGTLNELLTAYVDAEARYREAAQRLASDELRTMLLNRAAGFNDECEDLERWIAEYGGVAAPRHRGLVTGALYKTWSALRGRFDERGGDTAVLDDCAHAQEKILARFRAAAGRDLPVPVLTMIARRLETLQRNFDQIIALRDGSAVT